MKTLAALIFLAILLLKVSVFAQTHQVLEERNLNADIANLSETIDLYYEKMIALKTKLSLTKQKITSPHLSAEDTQELKFLEETRIDISEAFRNLRVDISSFGTNPQDLETFESAKHEFNLALVKAYMPRYQTAKTSLLTRLLATIEPQYVEEVVTRTEANRLMFTQFDSNEPSKDAMNSNFRFNEMIKAHNELAAKLNSAKEANIYQIYPTNLKLTTAAQEAALYQALVQGTEYKASAQSTIVATQSEQVNIESGIHRLISTCASIFGI